ncbi:MAG: ATP-binding cassette domain-containing protein [Litoreibacter sp.]
MITVSNLSHHVGSHLILSNISLAIPKGKITALIGPNGAGKSTLISLIARLISNQTGSIMVDDLEVGKTPDDVLARRLAILPQTAEAASRLTVKELVAFGRYPYSKGRLTQQDLDQIDDTLTKFELTTLAQRPLDTLSGGQRQRALVAMSFVQDTDYLLLDEPLNNLDIAASRSLMALMQDLAQSHHRTIVIVLHDINYASRYADHIVTLKNGILGPMGSPDEVITEDLLTELFGTNATVRTVDGRPVVLV